MATQATVQIKMLILSLDTSVTEFSFKINRWLNCTK